MELKLVFACSSVGQHAKKRTYQGLIEKRTLMLIEKEVVDT